MLPRGLPLLDGDVGDGLAVGGDVAVDGGGEREDGGRAGAVGVGAVELDEVGVAFARGGEEDVFAIGGPADGLVAGGIPGDAAGNATVGGDDVNLGHSIFMGGVGDLRAVRRIVRAGGDSADGGEALGIAAVAGNRPDVVRVDEGNVVAAEGGVA